MRITDLKASIVETDIPWDSQDHSRGKMQGVVVQIFTDANITGTYFAWERLSTRRGIADTLVFAVKPFIVGKNPFDRELIWQTLSSWSRKGLPMIGAGAIDVCLWDIAGKAFGVPVYQLLGAYREKMRVYASTTTLGKPADYADTAKQLCAQGYTAMKLHVKGKPAWDIEACQAARAAAPNIDIMLDASGHYDRRQALMVGREIEKLNFRWYESPLPDNDIEGQTELARVLDIPIAGAEYLYECNPAHYAPYIAGHVVDIVRTDARRGITPAKKIADMCAGFHMNCELHSWGSIIGQAANLHVMAAIPNCEFFEQAVPLDRFEVCAKDHFTIDSEGYVHVPVRPGMGVELDWDAIDKRTVYRAG